MGKHQFKALDGMRGVAALAVGIFHARGIISGSWDFGVCYLAVDFFFCLSGFVLASTYSDRIMSGNLGFRAYALKRMIRLYPMVVFGVLLGGISMAHFWTLSKLVPTTLGQMLLLPSGLIYGEFAFSVNNAIWSLFFEVFGSFLLFALVSRPKLVRIIAIAGAVALGLVIWSVGSFSGVGFANPEQFFFGFARLIYPFARGILIFFWTARNRGRAIPALVPIGLLVVCLALPPGPFVELAIVLFGVPALVTLGSCAKQSRLDGLFKQAGRLSYPFYAIHMPLFWLVAHAHLNVGWGATALGVVVALVLTVPVTVFYDEPVRGWLTARLRGRCSAPDTQTA
jgi:peptidoglycan/LPS O-acetylase OafA/YrhL